MKNVSNIIAMVLFSSSAFAASAGSFAGQYSLQREDRIGNNQQYICSESLQMAIKGKNISIATATFSATAEINGSPVKLVDSTKDGQLSVGVANNLMTISIEGVFPEYIAPGKLQYIENITLEQAANKLYVRHTFTTSLPAVIADSHCVYVKN